MVSTAEPLFAIIRSPPHQCRTFASSLSSGRARSTDFIRSNIRVLHSAVSLSDEVTEKSSLALHDMFSRNRQIPTITDQLLTGVYNL
jgi:hypothetical protein